MEHYSILGINQDATDSQIKKAYRTLAHKFHPDKNPGNKEAEDTFKKMADAYSVLSDPAKRRQYDDSLRPKSNQRSGFNFDEFMNNQFNSNRFRDGQFRSAQAKKADLNTSRLDIHINHTASLVDAVLGKKIEISFNRNKIKFTGRTANHINYIKEDESKEISIQLNLRKSFLLIKKEEDRYVAKVRVTKLGNEDIATQQNIWGDIEHIHLNGDLYVHIEIEIPENIEISDNNILHSVDIPLYKVITKGEKVRVETIFNKKYDAEINYPRTLTDLKFILNEQGIRNDQNQIGNYIIKFNIITPDLTILKKEEREQLLVTLRNI